MIRTSALLVVAGVLGWSIMASPLPALAGDEPASDATKTNPRWLLRLDKKDRALVDENVGYAPPEVPADLKWVGSEALDWDALRGKVVVLQTWNTKQSAARTWPQRAARATEDSRDGDAIVIALHTPDGAETAEKFLERSPQEVPVAIDPVGAFCDALGAYKAPVNIVIDKAGTVRYAGLNEEGLKAAVAELVEEDASKLLAPKPRPDAEVKSGPPAEFPTFSGPVGSANDVRGKRAPEFHVQSWLTDKPDIEGKVVIIDFWATWCGPCVAAIPHMSEIADEFEDEVAVIGISSETQQKCVDGIKGKNLRSKITYALAVDPGSQMANAISVRGIPHVIVLSSDWVVRWQGNPHSGLTKDVIRQIVEANGGAANADPRLRWTGKKKA